MEAKKLKAQGHKRKKIRSVRPETRDLRPIPAVFTIYISFAAFRIDSMEKAKKAITSFPGDHQKKRSRMRLCRVGYMPDAFSSGQEAFIMTSRRALLTNDRPQAA